MQLYMRTVFYTNILHCIILSLIFNVQKVVAIMPEAYVDSHSLYVVSPGSNTSFSVRQSGAPTYIPVTGVSLKVDTIIMEEGDRGMLTAYVYPTNATYNSVSWHSSNPSVATVYGGYLETNTIGTTTIKVNTFDGGFTDTCVVKVVQKEHALLTRVVTPSNSGTLSGTVSGRYKIGSSISVKAIPDTGYEFKHWMVNGDVVSTNIDYTFTLTTRTILTAVFYPAKTHVILTSSVYPSEGGKIVQGEGVYSFGSEAYVEAEANKGYVFKHWEVNGVVVSTRRLFTYEMLVDTELVAVFEKSDGEVEDEYQLLLLYNNPSRGGTIDGISSGSYKLGSPITVKAIPSTGYEFLHWRVNDVVVSTDIDYAFTFTAFTILTAVFHPAKTIVTLTVGVSPSGGGDYYYDTEALVEAKADEGYVFKHWEVNGVVVSTSQSFLYKMFADTELVAVFEKNDTSSAEVFSSDITIAAYKGTLTIQSEKELKHIVVHTVSGVCLYQNEINFNEVKISGLPIGLLIVTIDGQTKKVMMN